jgi:hypothetical protein
MIDQPPVTRTLKIFFHEACFDGTTSAALFAAFYRDVIDRRAAIVAEGVIHRDGDPFAAVRLDGDDHACVDFRFCGDPRMRWWFDHHPTAFQPAALREVFAQRATATRMFDPAAPSCAGLIARTLERGWAWRAPPHLREAVAWAERIDAARFPSAEAAIALDNPAQRLAAWLADGRTPAETARYVGWLARAPLGELAGRPEIAAQLAVLEGERARTREALLDQGVWAGDVVLFDRLGELGARSPGFLGYVLYPRCLYTVAATRSEATIKISVGTNPWGGAARRHDIGALCERHGGGGHAMVGGVTLRGDEVARAQGTLAAIVRELAGAGEG